MTSKRKFNQTRVCMLTTQLCTQKSILSMIITFSILTFSALALTVIKPGSAAHSDEVCKSHGYEWLCDQYIFQEIAIESSGVFGRDTDAFIS